MQWHNTPSSDNDNRASSLGKGRSTREPWQELADTLSSVVERTKQERNEARYLARVLASAWETDSRPPADVVKKALSYDIDQRR